LKSKLKFVLPLLLVAAGGVYKFVLSTPEPAPKPKIDGIVYVLPKGFIVNLDEGRYVKLSVALVLPAHGAASEEAGEEEGAAKPPEGFGPLPQEALVRATVTDTIAGTAARRLLARSGREALRARIRKALERKTDVEAHDVLFTDVTVQ
jgi:flagellar basal body-associated protein FliL